MVISAQFARVQELLLTASEIKNIQLPDGSRFTIQHAAAPFQIKLGNISLTVAGPMMEDLSRNVVASLNWLRHKKPHIDWDTSVLTVQ